MTTYLYARILFHHRTNDFYFYNRHYVAFIRKEIPDEGTTQWVLYNDEKVVRAVDAEEMKKFAYVYFFKRNS